MCDYPREIYETNINFVRGEDFITVSSTDSMWIARIHKLMDADPEISLRCKNANGSIVVRMPKKYLNLRKPPQREYTEEQRSVMRDRLMKARKGKSNGT